MDARLQLSSSLRGQRGRRVVNPASTVERLNQSAASGEGEGGQWADGQWAVGSGQWGVGRWGVGRWGVGRWAVGRWAVGRWGVGRWGEEKGCMRRRIIS